MRLAKDRFSKTGLNKRYSAFVGTPKEVISNVPHTRYTYETHNAIYDVDVRDSDGFKEYSVNCGFTRQRPYHNIHLAIEKHFGI